MMNDMISIVIPVYNGEKYLRETIESCLGQSYKNISIVIVNDASEDNSINIINDYSNIRNVKIVQNKTNKGLIKTANIGAQASDSKYLLFLGQDDLLPVNYIQEALLCFNKNTAFVYCNPVIIDQYGNAKGKIKKESEIRSGRELEYYMGKQNEIMSPGLIMDRRLFQAVGRFDEKYKNYGEWKLWIKLMKRGEAVYVRNVNSYYRRHKTNISNVFTNNTNFKSLKELHDYWLQSRIYAIRSFDYKSPQKLHLLYSFFLQWLKYKFEEIQVLTEQYLYDRKRSRS